MSVSNRGIMFIRNGRQIVNESLSELSGIVTEILIDTLEREDTSHWPNYYYLLKGGLIFLPGIPLVCKLFTEMDVDRGWFYGWLMSFGLFAVLVIPFAMLGWGGRTRFLPRKVTFDGERLWVKYSDAAGNYHHILVDQNGLTSNDIRYRVGLTKEDEFGRFLEREECVVIEIPSRFLRPRWICVARGSKDSEKWITHLEEAGVPCFKSRVVHDWRDPNLVFGLLAGGVLGYFVCLLFEALSLSTFSLFGEFVFTSMFAFVGLKVAFSFLFLDRWTIKRQPGGFLGTALLHSLPFLLFPFLPLMYGVKRFDVFEFSVLLSVPPIVSFLSVLVAYTTGLNQSNHDSGIENAE